MRKRTLLVRVLTLLVLLSLLFGPGRGGPVQAGDPGARAEPLPRGWFEGSGWVPVWLAPGGVDGDLYDVSVVSPDVIVAVGASGLVYRSDNGGDSWRLQLVNSKVDLHGVHMFNASEGLAVAEGGYIFRTENRGRLWHPVESGTTETLNDVWFVDDREGWAVGQGGTILHTTDGGRTWSAQHAGVTHGLKAVSFADARHGWIVGAGGIILHTEDGGATWTRQDGHTVDELRGVLALSPEEAWVVGRGSTIRHTTDGGATWEVLDFPTRVILYDVVQAPDGYIWVAANGGHIYRFDGTRFDEYTITGFGQRLNQPVHTLAFPDVNTLIVVGGSNTAGALPKGMLLARSSNGGETWDLPAGQGVFQLQDISMPTEETFWTVGQAADGGATLLGSRDGGQTWFHRVVDIDIAPRTSTQFMDVDFADEKHGIIVGRRSQVVDTRDGGETWRWRSLRDLTGVSETWLYAARYLPDGHVWTSGEFGQIFRSKNYAATWQNFNLSWTGLNIVSSRLYVNARPGGKVWAVGNTGIMVTSQDDGASWYRDSTPLRRPDGRAAHLRATYFLNDQEGWAVGYLGTVWHTTNGGRYTSDWEFIPLPSELAQVAWHDVHFFDPYHGILVGGECPEYECGFTTDFTRAAVAITADGGFTWEYEFLPDIRILYGLDARSPEEVYAVGDHGAILRFTGFPTHVDVFKLAEPLTVDGDLRDWPVGPRAHVDADNADYVDADDPPPAQDISGDARFFWDTSTLYVSVNITDDVVTAGDAVVLGLDSDRSKSPTEGDHTFRVYSDGRVQVDGDSTPRVQVGVQTHEHGYTVELGIPADVLAGHLKPWQVMGFSLGLEDDDGAGVDAVIVSDSRDPSRPNGDFGTLTLYDDHLVIRRGLNVYSALADAYIYRARPDDNFGEFDEVPPYRRLRLGWDRAKQWETRSILVDFDLQFLPPDAHIAQAQLRLRTRYRTPAYLQLRVAAYGVLKPWEELEVTWRQARSGVLWDEPGVNGENTDRDASPVDEQMVKGFPEWITWDVTDVAQRMLAGEAWGVLLRPVEGNATGVFTFISSEEEQALSEMPYVDLTYRLYPVAVPTPTPTPSPTPTLTPTSTPTPSPTPTPTPVPSHRYRIPFVTVDD